MSEPVSNAEVEDVLASIRRLVSEDKRTVVPPTAQSRTNTSEPQDAGKLVLTPSLRVMEPEKEAAERPDVVRLDEKKPAPEAIAANVQDDAVEIAKVSEACDAQHSLEGDDAHVQGGLQGDVDDPPVDPTGMDRDTAAAQNAHAAEALAMELRGSREATGADDLAAPTQTQMDHVDAGLADPHPAQAELTGSPEQEEPLDPCAPQAEDLPQELVDEAEAVFLPADTPEMIAYNARGFPQSLGAKIAALEAAVGKRQDEWEPDGVTSGEPLSGTEPPALSWEDQVDDPQADAQDVPVSEPVDLNADAVREDGEVQSLDSAGDTEPPLPDLTEEPALLDEGALQDMVAEIVRQELQGALGERITRNVRKLVRREIQRALAVHDLD